MGPMVCPAATTTTTTTRIEQILHRYPEYGDNDFVCRNKGKQINNNKCAFINAS